MGIAYLFETDENFNLFLFQWKNVLKSLQIVYNDP